MVTEFSICLNDYTNYTKHAIDETFLDAHKNYTNSLSLKC